MTVLRHQLLQHWRIIIIINRFCRRVYERLNRRRRTTESVVKIIYSCQRIILYLFYSSCWFCRFMIIINKILHCLRVYIFRLYSQISLVQYRGVTWTKNLNDSRAQTVVFWACKTPKGNKHHNGIILTRSHIKHCNENIKYYSIYMSNIILVFAAVGLFSFRCI